MCDIIPDDAKLANREEINRVSEILNGQKKVISGIRNEINNMCNRFKTMREFLINYPDRITVLDKKLYDEQITAFLHICFLVISHANSQGIPYIKPVGPQSTTTNVDMVLTMPHYITTKTIAVVDNMTCDFQGRYVYFGNSMINLLSSADLALQYSTVVETPEPYFSKEELLTGILIEMEKMIFFATEITRMETVLNSAIRYMFELKTIGVC